jgi:hypothetical protein
VLDGILLEKAGIPCVSIVTEPFRVIGQEMARSWGIPSYRFLVMDHPIANLKEEELDKQAEKLLKTIVQMLTSPA